MVRITQTMMSDRTLLNLQKNIQQITRLQDQLSTGRRIDKASDDAVNFPLSLSIRSTINQGRSFLRNIDGARSNLELTETTLNSLTETLQTIRTLAVQGASSIDPAARLALSKQVEELYGQVKDLSNANYNGQYIFGGSQTRKPAFEMKSSAILYTGDDFDRNVMVSKGSKITTNVSGNEVFLHTPNQITASLRVADPSAPLAEQLRLAHADFPNLPTIPDQIPGASVDGSPNPANYPGRATNNLASFTIYNTEVKVDLSVDSLEDVRDRINATVKDVTAEINDKNQLIITSKRADELTIQDGPRNIGFPPETPQQANLLGALGMHRRIEGIRSLNLGYPAVDPLTSGITTPTPDRSTVRLQNDSFLFVDSNIGPYDKHAVPFADNIALTQIDADGNEAIDDADDPVFINELEAIRVTINDEVIDIDLRSLSEGHDFDGIVGNEDDIPGSSLGDMLELINNHPLLKGKATAYINADKTGIGITATQSTDVFKVESVRKLFGRDLTSRVTVDETTGDTTVTRDEEVSMATLLSDIAGALVDPTTGSLGIRQPVPPPSGQAPSTNEGLIVISNNGSSEAVDLRYADTLGDVIRTINDSKVGVRAEINETHTGINIVSLTGHNDSLSVVDMADGTIARDLGLFRMPSPAAIRSNTGFAATDDIATALPTVSAGAFKIEVRDSAGRTLETYTVDVDPTDTFADIAAKIDRADGVEGPGGGLISATFSDQDPPNGETLNIVTHYNGHSIFIDAAQDTTGGDETTRFTALAGINQYTAISETSTEDLGPYVSSQDTAGILGIHSEGAVNEVEERNIFRTVSSLERALREDNTDGIKQALEDIDIDLDKVLNTRTIVGSRLNRLDSVKTRLDSAEDFMRQDLSSIEDADFARLVSELTLAQNAFNGALAASGKVIQQSLLNFLG